MDDHNITLKDHKMSEPFMYHHKVLYLEHKGYKQSVNDRNKRCHFCNGPLFYLKNKKQKRDILHELLFALRRSMTTVAQCLWSQTRVRRVMDSSPSATKDPPYKWADARYI
ncbi:hypothetical protein TNCV_365781 [Trichonephila clavipes]|nr:hypothetical protein TNCV_365781 [Trichonephila clavipes]